MQIDVHSAVFRCMSVSVSFRFSSVQMALTQQSSELKDTRMLTEFLEKVELEESHYGTLGQVSCGLRFYGSFAFMHLASAFIQSGLHYIECLHFISLCIRWESNP